MFLLNLSLCFFFFFNDTATTEIYTLSLHDALPISRRPPCLGRHWRAPGAPPRDRKSTRLNSSHVEISYAVFCLKKKKEHRNRVSAKPTNSDRPNHEGKQTIA